MNAGSYGYNLYAIECSKSNQTNIFLNVFVMFFDFIACLLSNNIYFLTLQSLFLVIVGFLTLKKKTKSWFSLPAVFLLLTYFFHCSYFILIISNNVTGNAHIFITLSDSSQIKVIKYCIMFIVFFVIGCCFFNNSKRALRKEKCFLTLKQCEKIGCTLMLLSFPFRIYVDVMMIKAYLLSGYHDTFDVYISNYIVVLANLFYAGSLLAIIGLHKQKKVRTILVIFIAVLLFGMVSGRRGIKVVYLVATLFVYFNYVDTKKKTFSTIAKYGILAYIVLAAVATFGDVRETGIFSIAVFLECFLKNVTYKLLLTQMGEFGYAAYTLGASIEHFSMSGYGYGLNYFASWLQIFPNVGGLLTGFSDKLSFVLKLPDVYQRALGGSMLGELFYNFGWLSFTPMLILGNVVMRLSESLKNSVKNDGLSYKGLLCILVLSPLILWIRSSFNEFPRAVVWYFIIIYLLRLYFKEHRKVV